MKKLVKFSANWADEFDVIGWAVLDLEDFDNLLQSIDDHDWENNPIDVSAGGDNRDIPITSKEEAKECYSSKIITDEQAEAIKDAFESKWIGSFTDFREYM